jgi:hypothetical protein
MRKVLCEVKFGIWMKEDGEVDDEIVFLNINIDTYFTGYK